MKTRTAHSHFVSALFLSWSIAGCSASPNSTLDDGENGPGATKNGGSVELPEGVEESDLLPARIRRLTNAEFNASVAALVDTIKTPANTFPADLRQHGYKVNEAQRVDPILARALDSAAIGLSRETITNIATLAPCADPGGEGTRCAEMFIDDFATQAYRRPLTTEDKASILSLYQAAVSGAGADPDGTPESLYADGIAMAIRGILQSPGFLYTTETGGVDPVGVIRMSTSEIAGALSYLTTGAPPDAELLADVASLADSTVREAHVRRLLATRDGRSQMVDLVSQWLGIDSIGTIDKDSIVYPLFSGARDEMVQETTDFVGGILDADGGSLEELLSKQSDVAGPNLSAVYGASGPARNGLLNLGAFLSVYAHANETAPILRGVAVLRRVVCLDLELPDSLTVEITPPASDPVKTNRQRFELHTQDSSCATCHSLIDPLGFVFEQFDGMGKHQPNDNGQPVDSTGVVTLGKDFDGSYASSTELAQELGRSAEVADCFSRQLYRASAAEGTGIDGAEAAFLDELKSSAGGDNLTEILVAYATRDNFILRKNP